MFQIFCCTAKIHQFEDPQPDHPPEKKSICKFYILSYIYLFFEYNSKYYLINVYKILIQFFSRSYRTAIKCL